MKKSKFDVEFQGSRLDLPEEILLKVLTPLPAKSIGRCRCVSKKWRTLLSDPNFIKTHLNHSLNNRPHQSLVFSHESSSFFAVDFHGRTTDHYDAVVSAAQRIKFDIPDDGYLVFRCSDHRNGLILVEDGYGRLLLLNPATRERKEFPKPPCSIEDLVFGIGNNKAVAINSNDYSVYVYTFKSNTTAVTVTAWKRLDQIQNSPLDQGNVSFRDKAKGVLFNGSIYWLGFTFRAEHPELPPILIAFDLTEETTHAIPIPVPLRSTIGLWITLGVVGGSLCIICQERNECSRKFDVWVMINECDMEEPWTKLSFYKNKGFHRVIFLGNEEFMLISYMSKAVIYNIKVKSSRNIVVSRLPFNLTEVDYCSTFVDSLVSPRRLL